MLTEAEQLSLDSAREEVRALLQRALEDLPPSGEDIGRGDVVAAIVLSVGGGSVSEYIRLINALKESALYNMQNGG